MMTERELDLARVEAKLKLQKMYEQWRADFLGRRLQRLNAAKNSSPSPETRGPTAL